MAYDKKLLAAARRELERERTAHTEELEARRRDIYTREPRIRAIDRELSTTAASVLRAAMESGGDPTAAIEKLRDRNLGLQEERGDLLRQLGLPVDYLTDKPLCPKCGDTGYAGQCDLRVRQGTLRQAAQGAAFLGAADCRPELFQVRHELLLHPPGWPQRYFAARKYGI